MVILETAEWARQTFGECDLGDRRRTKRLIKLAEQAASRPDGSTPDQTESWADCKAAYRLFDEEDVTFEEIIAPHCAQTRASCRSGDVKLLINDTTEIDYGMSRHISGLGPTGNGKGQGFFLHSALMVDASDGRVDGLAGQCLVDRFPRKPVSTWLVFLLLGMAAFGIEGWILWGNGIGLALVYLLTAVPALLMTWLVMKRRREDRGDG